MSSSKLSPVSEVDKISFPGEEELVLKLWKELKVFENCLKQSKDKPRFSFYDGPPFATGLPHYGHILAGTIKDVVTRWAHQTGFHVPRRFGWDTHGLPVEYEIDKTHGIKGPDDVAKMGIKKYNELCRGIVTRYADEWEQIVTRFGRWIDFRNDYKTMYPWFMESVWWVFSQLYNKGLVYRGFKVMPFSTACATPLSNFEAGQNYKDTQDPSVVVQFPVMSSNKVVSNDGTVLVAWTTTPWTLPSNLALCVNPGMDYVKVQGKAREVEGTFVLMEARLTQLFKSPDDYKVLSKFKGKELEGVEYKPLFTYFSEMKSKGAFKVLCDGYVTSESGTGIVHQAPYFGEDDFRVCLSYGIISKDQEAICPVDLAGRFTDTVTHFKGQHVKDADQNIIKHLREEKLLVSADRLNHSYPFCWRSDTPLIYKAVPSWFVRVQHMQEKLLSSNADTYWVPDFIKNKRFANWLRDARDWAISRNRYWGTPIPLWVSEDMEEVVCISSIAELERLSGEKITDIHRDSIDYITIPSSRPGQPPLKRVSEVFDCWFESGSMPYAQVHYPFENKNQFEDCFPADFIAEGVDQTRGWFYTLLVISTSLFGKAPFKNLIVNGLVLASDGQKMSKSKKNYPDPMTIVDKYGADAVRLYLVNSPAVRGENLRFKEDEVFALLKEVFIPWLNAYRYFVQQVERLEKDEGIVFQYDEAVANKPTNVMDKWILSFTQSLLSYVIEEMKAYRLYTVTPKLVKFVDNLTNWYVRFNRKRLKGDAGVKECQQSLNTLYDVLMTMVRIMSPFTPFITETMFQNLKKVLKEGSPMQSDSVHYLMVPTPRKYLINERTESAVSVLQSVVDLGRCLRDKINCPIKYPLPEVVVIQKDKQVLDDVMLLESYIKEELNVRKVTTSTDKDKYGVALKAEINFKLVGARLKGDVKKVQQLVAQLSDEEITKALAAGSIEMLGHKITSDEFFIKYSFSGKMADQLASKYQAHSDSSVLILLDTTPSQEMLWEGLAREVINRVQRLKKKAKLVPTDEVTVWYSVADPTGELPKVIEQHLSHIQTTTRAPLLPLDKRPSGSVVIIEDNDSKINSAPFKFVITKDYASGSCMASSSTESTASQSNETLFVPSVKLVLNGTPRNGYKNAKSATLLLQNPVGKPTITKVDEMYLEIERLFGIPKEKLQLSLDGKQVKDVKSLNNKTILVQETGCTSKSSSVLPSAPRFVNITTSDGVKGSILLENPIGCGLMTPAQLEKVSQVVLKAKGRLYHDAEKKQVLKANTSDDVAKLHGHTFYC